MVDDIREISIFTVGPLPGGFVRGYGARREERICTWSMYARKLQGTWVTPRGRIVVWGRNWRNKKTLHRAETPPLSKYCKQGLTHLTARPISGDAGAFRWRHRTSF